ncbi:DUF2243 domain-containing protein [Nafulsella turpanensis]|uniref:DUF2243 domain-containing protein n=1 Tax=Nafulsella turpanensis TaxID=1265690 RepID=UPI000345D62D|nr:DUF2243 domain-containing protein [Nafulsella turpanensis]
MNQQPPSAQAASRSFRVAFLIGVGIMAAIDEIVFHQLLAWHHFYDRATPEWALFSDGLLHAAELLALVSGFFLLSDIRRQNQLLKYWAWAGFFMGMGAFQLFDGIVDHKLLKLHQVRYGVENLLWYDIGWNAFGVLLLLLGWSLRLKAKRTDRTHTL